MKRYIGQKRVMRIYIDSADQFEGRSLWQHLVHKAKESGIAGATVFKGAAGMGAHSELHTFEIWSLSQKLPLVIEMIDAEDKLRSFLELCDGAIEEGLVTFHDAEVIAYKHRKTTGNK
jgi:PII-like signaling protein